MSLKTSKAYHYLGSDFVAGIVVFLVALPLCLGIALASDAPLFSGIVAGVIGGVVVGFFSKSQLSVSGPAAGLIIIVINAQESLGGFEALLAAVVIAGVLQLVLGLVKAGIIGMFFPSAVIKGMLAAIGIILVFKQIPHFMGVDSDFFGEMEFFQRDGSNTLSFLALSLEEIVYSAFLVGLASLSVVILWEQPFIRRHAVLKKIPGGLLAVLLGILINELLKAVDPSTAISAEHLVNLPILGDANWLDEVFVFPALAGFLNWRSYLIGAGIALIASLESLLSIEALEKIDPQKRHSPPNSELRAQGIGNILAGLVGGLPITAVIVRSSANLDAGGRSKAATITHGVILAVAVAFLPFYLNFIPLASLAAILIVVGWKLTKPGLYREQWRRGLEQFIPFMVTVVAIYFTDLLIGISVGLAVGIFFILRANFKVPIAEVRRAEEKDQSSINLRLTEHISFLNKASLQNTLDGLPEKSKITIDGSKCEYLDADAWELIHDFQISANSREQVVVLKDLGKLKS